MVTVAFGDIFKFWSGSEIAHDAKVHPRDEAVLARVDHNFNLKCLPGQYGGPLMTAAVVLLYLSPGFDGSEPKRARDPKYQQYEVECRKGYRPLPDQDEFPGAWKWWVSRTKLFGIPWEDLRDKVSILNIGAYHSKEFVDQPLLAALPSSRMSLGWAQSVLFPEAESGKRIVICLRAARFWGLDKNWHHGQGLFAPKVTRGGHIIHDGNRRNTIVAAVRRILRQ